VTHPDLPKLFAEACAVCPELCNYNALFVNGYFVVPVFRKGGDWTESALPPEHAAALILGACVRVLMEERLGSWWKAIESANHPDPACAACLAVIAVFGKEKP
jgi:hypothetical protein